MIRLALLLCVLCGCQTGGRAPDVPPPTVQTSAPPLPLGARPTVSATLVVPPLEETNRYHLKLGWAESAGAEFYTVGVGTNRGAYFRMVETPVAGVVVSNLEYDVTYYFSARAGNSAFVSDWGGELVFPFPLTNVITFAGASNFVGSTNLLTPVAQWQPVPAVFTNPPGNLFVRGVGSTNPITVTRVDNNPARFQSPD